MGYTYFHRKSRIFVSEILKLIDTKLFFRRKEAREEDECMLKVFSPGSDVKEEKGDNDEMFFVLITAGGFS